LPEIKLTPEEIRYISLFQEVTRANVKDCVIDNENNRIIFLVESKDMGVAIGKNGRNVLRAKLILKRYMDIDNVVIV